jgi:hypothetical protein
MSGASSALPRGPALDVRGHTPARVRSQLPRALQPRHLAQRQEAVLLDAVVSDPGGAGRLDCLHRWRPRSSTPCERGRFSTYPEASGPRDFEASEARARAYFDLAGADALPVRFFRQPDAWTVRPTCSSTSSGGAAVDSTFGVIVGLGFWEGPISAPGGSTTICIRFGPARPRIRSSRIGRSGSDRGRCRSPTCRSPTTSPRWGGERPARPSRPGSRLRRCGNEVLGIARDARVPRLRQAKPAPINRAPSSAPGTPPAGTARVRGASGHRARRRGADRGS